ncbi:MAG: hypothetical protein INR73_01260 [Williamsia sp.]|nr:hypothetical protein [Williamsia sp.]
MKTISLVCLVSAIGMLLSSCEKQTEVQQPQATVSFLRDIRPQFFEHLNFNSTEKIAEIPSFLQTFTDTYTLLEKNYKEGQYTSASDRDNMRLAGMYYAFGITAIVRAYLDKFIQFSDIVKGRSTGLFSGLSASEPGFEQKELEAMMRRAQEVAGLAVVVNGFNDKTYGTFMVSRQISERLKSSQHVNNPVTQDSMINYLNSKIVNYEYFAGWNALMSQLSFTNYNDSLNTFKNPKMDIALFNLNTRPLPAYTDRFPGLIGPVFRFDLNIKKVDWLLNRKNTLTQEDLQEIKAYAFTLDSIGNDIRTNKKALLDVWPYKETIKMRTDKLEEIKKWVADYGSKNNEKPQLKPFFISKNFLQAYQCYNCHRSVPAAP